ncbi:hypothetical protein TrST_g11711 [Triparma strigata]|uniref:Uncharacterized protein n=1 Tax=Triparma strigata TaxID=1606541 RepID=A0A9W7EE08_9STRA|nr:hypothetical protein TrST_g11711 [Triparma strigata]
MNPSNLKSTYLAPLQSLQSRSIPITYESLLEAYNSTLPFTTTPQLKSCLKKIHAQTLGQYETSAREVVQSSKVIWLKKSRDGLPEEASVSGFLESVRGWGGGNKIVEGMIESGVESIRCVYKKKGKGKEKKEKKKRKIEEEVEDMVDVVDMVDAPDASLVGSVKKRKMANVKKDPAKRVAKKGTTTKAKPPPKAKAAKPPPKSKPSKPKKSEKSEKKVSAIEMAKLEAQAAQAAAVASAISKKSKKR